MIVFVSGKTNERPLMLGDKAFDRIKTKVFHKKYIVDHKNCQPLPLLNN